LLFITWCFTLVVKAQYYDSGTEPFFTHWKQIKTPYFQIIFPEEYEDKAQVFAAKMAYAYDYVAQSMDSKPRKLSVIIHTQTANSNGQVAWAPRRMELWTVPSQSAFNYSQEWMEQLIIHETRHFVQENKMNQGLTKVLKIILGEQAEMVPLGLMVPEWFMEGDAVVTETALSQSGRGRMPSFEQGLRALTIEKGKASYDLAHLGSYKVYIPNHYEVGYHTVAVNRLYRDSAIFDRQMDKIGSLTTLKGFRDRRKKKYYAYAIDILDQAWREQDAQILKTPSKDLLKPEDDYHSYEFLQESDGLLYALKKSYADIPQVVAIDSLGQEEKVLDLGWMNEYNFSISNATIVYTDDVYDPRWEQRSYADVFAYHIPSGTSHRLTRKEVYQAPALSHDASKIVAQHVDGLGHYTLHILDAHTGRVLERLPNPLNQFYFSPQWSPDDKCLVYVAQEKDTKALKYYDLSKHEETLLVDGTYGEMAHPVWADDAAVYFTASYSGINNIYRCDIDSRAVKRVSSARFGADFPVLIDSTLYYADYSSDGYRPVQHVPSDLAGESLSELEDVSLGLAEQLTQQEGGAIDFSQAPKSDYEVSNYSRLGHLLHVHSWFPLLPTDGSSIDVDDVDDFHLYPYLSLLSQNKLSTSILTATYNGQPGASDERFKIDYSYQGFYPKLSLYWAWGDFQTVVSDALSPSAHGSLTTTVKDMVIQPSVSLPLRFKRGVRSIYFQNTVFYKYVKLNYESYNQTFNFASKGLTSYFVSSRQLAPRDLFSTSRQELSFYFSHDDFYEDPYKIGFKAKFYMKGLGRHHSMQYGLNYQQKDLSSSQVLSSLPRGYTSTLNERLAFASLDYYLPLAYPDFNLGGLLYVKRCSGGLYSEWAKIYSDSWHNLVGFGASLFFDVNLFRYEVDFTLGVQAGYAFSSLFEEPKLPFNFILEFDVF